MTYYFVYDDASDEKDNLVDICKDLVSACLVMYSMFREGEGRPSLDIYTPSKKEPDYVNTKECIPLIRRCLSPEDEKEFLHLPLVSAFSE